MTKHKSTASQPNGCHSRRPVHSDAHRSMVAHSQKVMAGSIKSIASGSRARSNRQLDVCIEWKRKLGTKHDIAAILDTPREAFIMLDGIAIPVKIFNTGVPF